MSRLVHLSAPACHALLCLCLLMATRAPQATSPRVLHAEGHGTGLYSNLFVTLPSHIDALINARNNRTKKMQWTREGAHHVLQIRALMASDEWESKGQNAVLLALGAAA